jgi:hypothetical protein
MKTLNDIVTWLSTIISKVLHWLFPAPDTVAEKVMYTFLIISGMSIMALFSVIGLLLNLELFDIPDLASQGYTIWACAFFAAWVIMCLPIYGIVKLTKLGISMWKEPFTTLKA